MANQTVYYLGYVTLIILWPGFFLQLFSSGTCCNFSLALKTFFSGVFEALADGDFLILLMMI